MTEMTELVIICREKGKRKEERKVSDEYEQRKCVCYSQCVKNGSDRV